MFSSGRLLAEMLMMMVGLIEMIFECNCYLVISIKVRSVDFGLHKSVLLPKVPSSLILKNIGHLSSICESN